MRTDTGQTVRLEEYEPTPYAAPDVTLSFALNAATGHVTLTAETVYEPREASSGGPLVLAGDGLDLAAVRLDGFPLGANRYVATPDQFVLNDPPQRPFRLTVETRLEPDENTELMGLYRSQGVFCTQCEAEGFRRITYAYDRPDVLSVYRVRMALQGLDGELPMPVLLSNGNLERAEVKFGEMTAEWFDPFPKPTYLFALVVGKLAVVHDRYVTSSGRNVRLGIYVEPGKEPRTAYAMDALKRAMRWDEERFGREYDLEEFNVVAVSDFNMGAMENKGLNVFNDRYVLADPTTATDNDYAGIETVVAHEYFHNWTGNRITCRDWFQLCLKEGLTVFRDQEFTADMRSKAVKRIDDAKRLRSTQFTEDASPLRHAVRPNVYAEISNLYTATVYEKGAELIRVLKTLVGDDAFHAGMNAYFDRFDGIAATVEDFLSCFLISDPDSFMRWYEEPGTPTLLVRESNGDSYVLTLRQLPANGARAKPLPVRLAILGQDGPLPLADATVDGASLNGDVIVLDEGEVTVRHHAAGPSTVASVLREFSAPVHIDRPSDVARDLALLARDDDAFSAWDAAQRLELFALTSVYAGDDPMVAELANALSAAVRSPGHEPAFRALLLAIPTREAFLEALKTDVDATRLDEAHRRVNSALGAAMSKSLTELADVAAPDMDAVDPASAGRRALRNAAVALLAHAGDTTRASAQAGTAANMTDRLAGLSALVACRADEADDALARFADDFSGEPLVLDKFFALNALRGDGDPVARVTALSAHPAFSLANPNRIRSLYGAFTQNLAAFHAPDGSGYRLVGDVVRTLDAKNPQVAARLLTSFGDTPRFDAPRRTAASQVLSSVAANAKSSDVADIARRLTSDA